MTWQTILYYSGFLAGILDYYYIRTTPYPLFPSQETWVKWTKWEKMYWKIRWYRKRF